MNQIKTIPEDAILEIVNAIRAKGKEYYKSYRMADKGMGDFERISLFAKSVGCDEAAEIVMNLYLGEEE